MKQEPGAAVRQSLRRCSQRLWIRWCRCVSALQTRCSRMPLHGAPSDMQLCCLQIALQIQHPRASMTTS